MVTTRSGRKSSKPKVNKGRLHSYTSSELNNNRKCSLRSPPVNRSRSSNEIRISKRIEVKEEIKSINRDIEDIGKKVVELQHSIILQADNLWLFVRDLLHRLEKVEQRH